MANQHVRLDVGRAKATKLPYLNSSFRYEAFVIVIVIITISIWLMYAKQ